MWRVRASLTVSIHCLFLLSGRVRAFRGQNPRPAGADDEPQYEFWVGIPANQSEEIALRQVGPSEASTGNSWYIFGLHVPFECIPILWYIYVCINIHTNMYACVHIQYMSLCVHMCIYIHISSAVYIHGSSAPYRQTLFTCIFICSWT